MLLITNQNGNYLKTDNISCCWRQEVKGAQMNYWVGHTFAVFLESNLVVPIKNQIALQNIYTKKTILYICNSKKEEWKLLLEPSKEKWKSKLCYNHATEYYAIWKTEK